MNSDSEVVPLQDWLIEPEAFLKKVSSTEDTNKQSISAPLWMKEFSSSKSYAEVKSYLRSADNDGMVSLCVETVIKRNKSVIVFCPTRKWCDKAAYLVSQV